MDIDYFFNDVIEIIKSRKHFDEAKLLKSIRRKGYTLYDNEYYIEKFHEYILNGFIQKEIKHKKTFYSSTNTGLTAQRHISILRYARYILYLFWLNDIFGEKPEDFGEKTFQQLTLKPGDIPKKYGRTQEEIETMCASAIELLIGQKLLQQNENNNYVVTKDVIEYYNTDIFDEDSIL